MYFYALDTHAEPIVGFMTEGPDCFYTQHVLQGTFAQLKSGTLNPPFACILQNTTLIPRGSGNSTVHVECGTSARFRHSVSRLSPLVQRWAAAVAQPMCRTR